MNKQQLMSERDKIRKAYGEFMVESDSCEHKGELIEDLGFCLCKFEKGPGVVCSPLRCPLV